jgi:hypothetical protein
MRWVGWWRVDRDAQPSVRLEFPSHCCSVLTIQSTQSKQTMTTTATPQLRPASTLGPSAFPPLNDSARAAAYETPSPYSRYWPTSKRLRVAPAPVAAAPAPSAASTSLRGRCVPGDAGGQQSLSAGMALEQEAVGGSAFSVSQWQSVADGGWPCTFCFSLLLSALSVSPVLGTRLSPALAVQGGSFVAGGVIEQGKRDEHTSAWSPHLSLISCLCVFRPKCCAVSSMPPCFTAAIIPLPQRRPWAWTRGATTRRSRYVGKKARSLAR